MRGEVVGFKSGSDLWIREEPAAVEVRADENSGAAKLAEFGVEVFEVVEDVSPDFLGQFQQVDVIDDEKAGAVSFPGPDDSSGLHTGDVLAR